MNVDLEDVLAALRRARGKGLTLKQLSGQLHLAPHGLEIEPRIDQRAIEIKDNAAKHEAF